MRTNHDLSAGSAGDARLIVMADETAKAPSRSPVKRIRTLATAALTADEKVDQLDALLVSLPAMMSGLEGTMRYTEETLAQVNESISEIGELSPRLIAMVDRMEAMVSRVERLIDLAEMSTGPLTLTDSAVRGVVGAIASTLGPRTPDKASAKPVAKPSEKPSGKTTSGKPASGKPASASRRKAPTAE